MRDRQLYQNLWHEQITEKSMVFISGPRQTGKTTFANTIIGNTYPNKVYFNWDIIKDKKNIIENPTFFENVPRVDNSKPLVIFDEIHKYKNWKSYLKGVYDEFKTHYHFIASGSGRLDLSKKKGESLAGRYLEMHLFPFTLAELTHHSGPDEDFFQDPLQNFVDNTSAPETSNIWEQLAFVGGFPEPFIKGRQSFWLKWFQTVGRQVIREDMQSIREIRLLDDLEILFSLLPTKVGNPLSINQLAQDLQVSFDSVKQWLSLLDHFYLTFRLSPWSHRINRGLLKEKKLYLYHYPHITNPAAKFENMVALELLRAITYWNEFGWGDFSLHYLRNKGKKEVDFLIVRDTRPILLIECKQGNNSISENLRYFQGMLGVPAVQLVNQERVLKKILTPHPLLVITAHRWLACLP